MRKLKKNWLEWTIFAVSLVVVLGTIGYLIYQSVTHREGPPLLEVQLGVPKEQGGYFVVPVTIFNRGGRTAEEATVEVALEESGKLIETATFQVSYVPYDSKREGWVSFRHDPRTGRLRANAPGYEQP